MLLDDVAPDKLEFAKRCGADEALNITKTDIPFELALTTIIISGANQAYDSAANLTKNHGIILGIGLPPAPVAIPA
jgi:D-arabinose 1-dehydrogenase-like Zn-dependent alcohol dehydrogenase